MINLVDIIFRNFRRIDWYVSKNILKKLTIRRQVYGFKISLDLINPGISKTLAIYRKREDDMVQVIKEVLHPGMNVVDCGSNLGFYPLLIANILKNDGIVYAIEPDPRNYELLKQNVDSSFFRESIKIFQMAVSNKVGTENMYLAEQTNLNKLMSTEDDNFPKRHTVNEIIEVPTTTLDAFCKEHKVILDFVRMDIEGFEVEVFQGMKNIFKTAKRGFMIFVELHPHAYSSKRNFSNEIEKLFLLGFNAKLLISAGEEQPQKYIDLGYSPTRTIRTDGMMRGIYENVKNEDVVPLTCFAPKASRYALFEKIIK